MPTGFNGLLTVTVFLPAVAALLLAVGLVRDVRHIRWFAAAVAAADLVLSVVVFAFSSREGKGSNWSTGSTGSPPTRCRPAISWGWMGSAPRWSC